MSPSADRLSPRAARVLYNVADAWAPPSADAPGGGDLDLVPAVERRLAPRERRALEWTLRLLEWEPRLRLRSRRGFAWQSRSQRRALLASWEASVLPVRRRAAVRLRALVEAALREARSGPAAGRGQSRDGA